MSRDTLFAIRELNVWYRQGKRKLHVLKNISADIPEGTITVILGRSGSGKTTFLRTLNRLVEIYSAEVKGEVYFKDRNIFEMNVYELRSKVVMVLQRPVALPLSIRENIACFLRSVKKIRDKKVIDRKVEESLKLADLWDEVRDRLDQPASSLSGGQIQRLAIARALALEPEVLLLDEPTAHLDPESSAKVEETILKLRERVNIILVTHSVEQARRLGEYVLFFDEGKLIEHGYAEEVLEKPRTERLRKFLGIYK